MDAKITLCFNEAVIQKAKQFADKQNISLSRLMEMVLHKITSNQYTTLEDYPISDWVNELSFGKNVYQTTPTSKTAMRAEFYNRKGNGAASILQYNEPISLVAEDPAPYRVKRGRKLKKEN